MAQEKRTFSRAATRIRGYVRQMKSASSLPMLHETHPIFARSEGPGLQGVNLQEPLIDFLESLNAKLDTLISFVNQDRLQNDFQETVEVVELSGGGLRFSSEKKFNPGDVLEIVLVLSQIPLRLAAAVGKIERDEVMKKRPVWVLEFTSVRESDLEAIVAFVFKEEREKIRGQKWGD